MAAAADAELAQLLAALGSPEKGMREPAEALFANNKLQHGFPARLAAFGVSAPADSLESVPLRQMALTLLRRTAQHDWPSVSEDDKTAVKRQLVMGLAEENKAIRTMLHACVAMVRDGGAWPELDQQLAAGIGATAATTREAECCVECVVVLIDDCAVSVARALAPLQEPMLQIALDASKPATLRRQCVTAHAAAAENSIRGYEDDEAVCQAVAAGLPAWVQAGAALCAGVDGWTDADRIAAAFTAVRSVTTLCRLTPLRDAMGGIVEQVLRPACLVVQQLEPAYQASVIDADDAGASEEDGGMAPFVAQLMELLQVLLLKPKTRAALKGNIKNMLQLVVPFMRVTEAQVAAWRADPNEFLAHEDDDHVKGCVVRLSGEGLVGELLENCRRETTKALAALIGDLLERGERGRAAGEATAWKLSEVALFLFGIAAPECQTKSLQTGDLAPVVPTALSTAARLCAEVSTPEFLRSRAFFTLWKCGDAVKVLVPADVPALLTAAASGLAQHEPKAVRVSACRAFCRFLTAVTDTAFRDALLLEKGVLASLASLVRDSDEELLHLTLESLTLIVRLCASTIGSVSTAFAELVVEIWQQLSSDPLVHMQVLDLVSCAASNDPRLQTALEAALLPKVMEALQLQDEETRRPLACAVEMLGVLLKRAAVPFTGPLWACVQGMMPAAMKYDESGLLQNFCDTLCLAIKRSPEQMGEESQLRAVLAYVERLLGPELDDEACVFVGPLVTLVLTKYGAALPQTLTAGIVRALAARLARANRPYLQQELLVVIGRLLIQDLASVCALLGEAVVQPAESPAPCSGLEFVITWWMANLKDIRAKRARNVTYPALCLLYDMQAHSPLQLRPGGPVAPALKEQFLAALVYGFEFENERCKKLREVDNKKDFRDCDDDDDDDEDIDSDDCDDPSGKGRGVNKLLSDLVDMEDFEYEELSEGGLEGDTFQEMEFADPFFSLNLRRHLADFFTKGLAHGQIAAEGELAPRIAAAIADVQAHP